MTIGAAIRTARGTTTQAELADLLGTTQPNVSKWERDEHRPSIEELAAVEDAVGRPRGFILRLAGYVEAPTSLRDTIDADTSIDDQMRTMLLAVLGSTDYRADRPAQRRPRRASPPPDRP